MHRGHLVGCGLAVAVALVVFTTTGGSAGGLGLLAATLVCPIAMGAVLWFLMGSARGHEPGDPTPADEAPHDTTAPGARVR